MVEVVTEGMALGGCADWLQPGQKGRIHGIVESCRMRMEMVRCHWMFCSCLNYPALTVGFWSKVVALAQSSLLGQVA